MDEILFGAKVTLGCLPRGVSQQQLDLLKFAAGRPTQLCASSSKVMRRDAWNTNCRSVLLEHLPYDLLTQALARHHVSPVHGTKHIAIRDAGRGSPSIDRHFDPRR